jgi:mannose-1-phosphate guanylyltransferase
MLGNTTMIQATVDRLGALVPPERTLVATTELLAGQIADQLSQLPREAIVVEPCKRDTAPCIGLAATRIVREDPEAIMAVMPSDHVIGPDESFQGAMRFAASLVEEEPTRMVTFGIRPTYPAESFGYVERGAPLQTPTVQAAEHAPPIYHVQRFHEKPKADVARSYTQAGTFYWNSGIFVWKAATILAAIEQFQPRMHEHLRSIADAADSPNFAEILQREFEAIEPISIDFGVMERASDVVVVEAPFDWDDVGSWRALERLETPDADGNVIDAARCVALDTAGCIVRCNDPQHAVVTVGTKDLIVIVTPDATLIADKGHEESIRQVTRLLQQRGWEEYL